MQELPEIEDDPQAAEKAARMARTSGAVGHVRALFEEASTARRPFEDKWLRALLNYRGEYTPQEMALINIARQRNPFASAAFIRITKTKVMAAYGQMLEVLFAGNKIPIGIEPTPVPDEIADTAFIAPENFPQEDVIGYAGDGREIEPGATAKSLLHGLVDKYKQFMANGKKAINGPSPNKAELPQINPAQEAALSMEKLMHDQLLEGDFVTAMKRACFEGALLGTMAIKGPVNINDKIDKWEQDEETGEMAYRPKYRLSPRYSYVSCWNLYLDATCTTPETSAFYIERHLLSKYELRKLKSFPQFDRDAINRLLERQPSYAPQHWEGTINENNTSTYTNRYEVLEYWGYLDVPTAQALGMKVDSEVDIDEVQVNIWICDDEVIKAVQNPYTPERCPYFIVPYEERHQQPWGIGVAENMEDTQILMNGHMRMAIDNLQLAGSCVLEVDEKYQMPGQDYALYPGKIFRKQGGPPGQSIYSISFNNTSQSHYMAFDKARQLADEATGLPSYSHGQTGVSGTTRTSSGMSMLMSASALNIKTVIKNIDTYLNEPLGRSLYNWNMEFNKDKPDIRGDLRIVARGTTSLMQREVLTQRLMSMIQVASNPLMAPFFNAPEAFKQLAINLELDPEKLVNTPEQARLYAEIMGQLNATVAGTGQGTEAAGGQPQGAQGAEPAMGGINPADVTGSGGGNIGTGFAPRPGEAGFSGNAPATA